MNMYDKYTRLKKSLEELGREASKLEGRLETFTEQLTEKGFDSIKQAEKALSSSEAEIVTVPFTTASSKSVLTLAEHNFTVVAPAAILCFLYACYCLLTYSS